MSSSAYSEEELAVIRTVFDSCDGDRSGRIHINQLSGMLMKLGKTDGKHG
jgi:Ca2+-binding EF-hand superfamily protein